MISLKWIKDWIAAVDAELARRCAVGDIVSEHCVAVGWVSLVPPLKIDPHPTINGAWKVRFTLRAGLPGSERYKKGWFSMDSNYQLIEEENHLFPRME